MIGPSSGTGSLPNRELPETQSRSGKKRIFEELDVENFCEENCQDGCKRYLQEVQAPIEFVSTNEVIDGTTTLFSPVSGQETADDCQVARLEVLLVDGTTCTWATVSELGSQQTLPELTSNSSPSSLSSSYSIRQRQEDPLQEEVRLIEDISYQSNPIYWDTVSTVVTIPPDPVHRKPEATSSSIAISRNQNNHQQQFDDQETGNLSWLLDFKLDPFIDAPDDKGTVFAPLKNGPCGTRTKLNGRNYGSTGSLSEFKRSYNSNHESSATTVQDFSQNGYSNPDDRSFNSSRYSGPKKPPFTYTELIEHALQERGELTVSAIYQWISEHFPYYKSNDDRWKNSVRHNLSINPHFRKGSKAPHGAGHLWAIASRSDMRPRDILTTSASNNFLSAKTTFRCISDNDTLRNASSSDHSQLNPIDEVEMATASIMQQSSEEQVDNVTNSVSLEHCAEQILSGIKKEVEVQYLVPMTVTGNTHGSNQPSQAQTELHYPIKESDFLNPVSKEVVAEECGLISEGYLVTELNSSGLGLNMVDPEIITPENLFGEELNLQFYELASPSQLQSA